MIDGFDQMDIPCCCICLVIAMVVCRDWSEIKIEVQDFSLTFLIWEYYSEKAKSDIESDSEPEDKPRFNILNLNNVIMHWFRRILDFSYFSAEILRGLRSLRKVTVKVLVWWLRLFTWKNQSCHQHDVSQWHCHYHIFSHQQAHSKNGDWNEIQSVSLKRVAYNHFTLKWN